MGRLKSFREYIRDLQEAPQFNSYHSHDSMTTHLAYTREMLANKAHNKETDRVGRLGHHIEHEGKHYYFRMHKGVAKEVSIFDKNHQEQIVHKTPDGNSIHNRHFMTHHIMKHSKLQTDPSHTPGTKHLWIKYIKSKPKGISFEYSHETKGITKLDHKNIDSHADHIWGKEEKFKRRLITAYKSA